MRLKIDVLQGHIEPKKKGLRDGLSCRNPFEIYELLRIAENRFSEINAT